MRSAFTQGHHANHVRPSSGVGEKVNSWSVATASSHEHLGLRMSQLPLSTKLKANHPQTPSHTCTHKKVRKNKRKVQALTRSTNSAEIMIILYYADVT